LTASAAAQAIARGWSKVRPSDSLDLLPITDGGDGFGEAMGGLLRAKVVSTPTVDAAHRPCVAKWWWEPRTTPPSRSGRGRRAWRRRLQEIDALFLGRNRHRRAAGPPRLDWSPWSPKVTNLSSNQGSH